jgi:hypothetical protein
MDAGGRVNTPILLKAGALLLAKQRWGDTAWVRKLRTDTKLFEIYRMVPRTFGRGHPFVEEILGAGESWDAAFADADRRAGAK